MIQKTGVLIALIAIVFIGFYLVDKYYKNSGMIKLFDYNYQV